MNLIIKKPWVTEKATDLAKMGKYVFQVGATASKRDIAHAVKTLYKVDPIAVNIVNRYPKKRGFGRVKGTRGGHKKAIVTLKRGQTIDVA